MEVRIKQGEEMIDATIEMVDGVMVVSPKEVKFEPKDGDVIVGGDGYIFVTIFNKMKEEYSFYYYALVVLGENKRLLLDDWAGFVGVRSATEEEKKLLFDKLADEGLEWKADTKELVKLKWKPKVNEDFYYPSYIDGGSFEASVSRYDKQSYIDDDLDVQNGMCFKTEQECQEFCNRLNEAIKQVKP